MVTADTVGHSLWHRTRTGAKAASEKPALVLADKSARQDGERGRGEEIRIGRRSKHRRGDRGTGSVGDRGSGLREKVRGRPSKIAIPRAVATWDMEKWPVD